MEATTGMAGLLGVTVGPATDGPAIEADFLDAYQRHRAQLLGWLRARMRDPEAAEDCCQETYTRLYCELQAGRRPDTPGAWLHQVARNLLVSRARHAAVVAREARCRPETGGADPTTMMVLDREAWVEVVNALRSVSEDERAVLALAAAGLSGAELAARLGTSQVAARTRLHRARRRLRSRLEPDAAWGPTAP